MSETLEQYSVGYRADPIVEMVCAQLRARSALGQQKYGCTLDRADYQMRDWLVHALEEELDKVLYLQAALYCLERLEAGHRCCHE